jgi:hypothetical protein
MIHNTHFSRFIHPSSIQKSAGTWTPTYGTNTVGDVRSAADASFNLFIPVKIDSNSKDKQGAYLTSIDVFYTIGTAAADDFATVELEKMTVSSVGAVTGEAPTVTLDTGHDTAAERKATGNHKMTLTLSTPIWVDDDVWLSVYCVVDAAATTVFTLWGARANFTFRA